MQVQENLLFMGRTVELIDVDQCLTLVINMTIRQVEIKTRIINV